MADTPKRKGFLLVTMDPSPLLEDEFNDWYDMEHVPDRAGIAGFESALRFVCVSGWPKYLAFYDLAEAAVLESDAYKTVSWGGFSPWTKRIVPKVRGQYRGSGDQVYPGNALTGPMCRLMLIRFGNVPDAEAGAVVEGTLANFAARRETRQIRVMRSDYGGRIDYLAMIEARVPFADASIDPAPFGPAADRIDLVNEYVPYWTRGVLPGVLPGK